VNSKVRFFVEKLPETLKLPIKIVPDVTNIYRSIKVKKEGKEEKEEKVKEKGKGKDKDKDKDKDKEKETRIELSIDRETSVQ